ncbi:hypothetical protein GCM10011608_45700 [Micromonospora sonchi]|uniref:Uncharacterized protein n=1 Tax=Micromonospora sonchi TaxID=1763543 RepID=A0A917U3Y1_9ACTN|nr:hypothetical protein GCM10011608_45700 [Micromonospora sonchi]
MLASFRRGGGGLQTRTRRWAGRDFGPAASHSIARFTFGATEADSRFPSYRPGVRNT